MKKWFVLAVAMMMVAGVQAAEKGEMTKEKFVAAQKKKLEEAGKPFDKSKVEAAFAKKDKNGDGVLSADEMAAPAKPKAE